MQYIRTTTKQEAVESETPEEAQAAQGKTIDITVRVSPRPAPAVQPGRATPGIPPSNPFPAGGFRVH